MARRQKLITKAIEKQLKKYPLYSQENEKDPKVLLKIFNPQGSGTWLITECDVEKGLAFGATNLGHGWELGYIDLNELKSYRGRWGLPLERDQWFSSCPLSEAKNK